MLRPESGTDADRQPQSAGWQLLSGLAGGAVAGVAAGAIDALWSWPDLQQFLPGLAGKLRYLGFLAMSYGLIFALVGVAGAAVVCFYDQFTRLGDLLRAGLAQHRAARARDPGDALIGLSLAITGVPLVAGLLGATYMLAVPALQTRKHLGLVIAVAMASALGAVAAAVLLSFVVARPVELGLRALVRRTATGARILSSPRAPLAAALALAAGAAGTAVMLAWETLALLALRPLWVVCVAALLAPPAVRLGARAATTLGTVRTGRRWAAAATLLSGFAILMLAAGAAEGTRKAVRQYSGLGGAITQAVRTLIDFDRDGHSPILGGGDCDDWNRYIHPGAREIPDDGIDQNCVGGDPPSARSVTEVAFAPVPSSVPADFNVLFLTIDTIRADHLGAYGYERPTSPYIDAVAKDGALFLNGWAHAPSTRYSIPAILTGRYPLAVAYDDSIRGWPGLRDENTTIAELMRAAGMTTGAILNYWYFDRHRNMDQGVDVYDNQNKKYHKQVSGQGPAQTKGSSSRQQTDKALQFLANHGNKRFFLWVHYYDPHYEYETHPEVPSFGSGKIDRYNSEIRFTDLHVGRLIDGLKQRGLYQRTVIVITGDHGEGFGEHGIDLHGYHLYAAQTKVPFIIRVPGLAPVQIATPVAHIDLLPTLANLAGLPPADDMMGRSLVDMMSGQADPNADRYIFQQLSYENNNEMRAAASKQCHVIYNVSPNTSWELYRIDTDPAETRDIIDDPGPCSQARARLEAWYDRSELPAGAAAALLPQRPEIKRPVPVDFAEVRLLGVDIAPKAVRPGQSFAVTYTFAAAGKLSDKWRVFAHFEGPGRFQGDHAPQRPFSWWQPGQYIRYTHTVVVPRGTPPGRYQMWMGLFHKSQRRPARSETVEIRQDRALTGAIQVRK